MNKLKVGERITLEVVESPSCEGCYFANSDFCPHGCVARARSDGKNVIFKKVKKKYMNEVFEDNYGCIWAFIMAFVTIGSIIAAVILEE